MRRLGRLLLISLSLGLVGCDHATKFWAERELQGGSVIDVVPGMLDFTYAQNHAIAFNLLDSIQPDFRLVLILSLNFAALLLVIAAWRHRFREATALEQTAFALLLGGALGNVTDRMVRGYVVDFIHLHYWPVFNVADIAIVLGMFLMLVRARFVRASTA